MTDELYCVRGLPEAGLVKGKIYPLLNTLTCTCGNVAYDVGFILPYFIDGLTCPVCRKEYECREWWFPPSCFTKLSDVNLKEVEVLLKENELVDS